jgi:peptide/nickel transport system permease protein
VNRLGYVASRLAQMVPVVFGVTVLVFFLVHLIPGDPAQVMLGEHATDQAVKALDHQWGLDQPLPVQYGLFMGKLFHGDLGTSLFYRVPATTLIATSLPVSLLLMCYVIVLALLISVPLATLAATHKDGPLDQVVRAVPMVGLGMPHFWVGIILILLLALGLHLFPVGGFGQSLPDHLWSLFLPGLTVAMGLSPILIRSLRASMVGVLEADYVATARSKGLPRSRVLLRHVLRNAIVPTITVLGLNIGFLVGSTVVVETVFALPGLGRLMITAAQNRDFPVVQAVTLVMGIVVVLINLLTDITYSLLDPRVRFD